MAIAQAVVAFAAVGDVGATPAERGVVAVTAVHGVVAVPAADDVVVLAAVEAVVAVAAAEAVAPGAAVDRPAGNGLQTVLAAEGVDVSSPARARMRSADSVPVSPSLPCVPLMRLNSALQPRRPPPARRARQV